MARRSSPRNARSVEASGSAAAARATDVSGAATHLGAAASPTRPGRPPRIPTTACDDRHFLAARLEAARTASRRLYDPRRHRRRGRSALLVDSDHYVAFFEDERHSELVGGSATRCPRQVRPASAARPVAADRGRAATGPGPVGLGGLGTTRGRSWWLGGGRLGRLGRPRRRRCGAVRELEHAPVHATRSPFSGTPGGSVPGSPTATPTNRPHALRAEIAALDAAAVDGADHWWSLVLEQLEQGLL